MAGRRPSGQRGFLMIDAGATERFMAAPWLADVDPDAKQAIFEALVEARAPAGATLLEQDQPNDHLCFLIDGTAEIRRTFEDGRREVITTISAPSVFGTTSFFRPDPPSVAVRATSGVWMLSLYHPAHEALRRKDPRAAEALAVAILRALSERFDLMDHLLSDYISRHGGESSRTSEWAGFRARLFDERGL
jgi:CRP/FNR family cyclic AMP-dependent transcriptional regulator